MGHSAWYIGLIDPERVYCFRKLMIDSRRKWYTPWRKKYLRTGQTWIGGSLVAGHFELID